ERGYIRAQQSGDQVVMNQALLLRGRIYREQGNFAASQAALNEVEPRLRKALPPGHLAFAILTFEYALLAYARHDLSNALQLIDQSLAMTDAAIKAGRGGDDFLPALLTARSDIERDLGRKDDAVADAGQALKMLQKSTEPGAFTSLLGHAYFT